MRTNIFLLFKPSLNFHNKNKYNKTSDAIKKNEVWLNACVYKSKGQTLIETNLADVKMLCSGPIKLEFLKGQIYDRVDVRGKQLREDG